MDKYSCSYFLTFDLPCFSLQRTLCFLSLIAETGSKWGDNIKPSDQHSEVEDAKKRPEEMQRW